MRIATELGVSVVVIDVEGTAAPDNLIQLGVDPSKVFTVQPKEGETLTIEFVTDKVKEVARVFGDAGVPLLIIWDSLASTAAEQQLKEGFNPNQMGVVAKAISNMTVQIGQLINQTNTAFVILNQARDDLKANPMFPAIKSTGGRAMEHWGSVRLEVQKASQLKEKVLDPITGKEKDDYIGHIFRLKTKKSKVSTPNRQAEVYLISQPYIGLDFVENVYRSSVDDYGFISKGAWRNYVTEDGEEVKLRDKDWVPFLRAEENYPILLELFHKQMKQAFPHGYAPLNNDNIDITKIPYYIGLEEYYEEAALATEAPESATEEG